MSRIQLVDLSKEFGSAPLFRQFNLDIPEGKLTVILGPSGCGKTTLLRLIAGLEFPDSGSILIGGRDVTRTEPRHRKVAMVFQNYALYPHLTTRENLEFPLRVARMPRQEIRDKVEKTAELLGLSEMLERYPKTLSGGERQRTAVGRAIIRDPELFLFDEPLSNLDFQLRHRMRAELVALQRRLGKTMIYVTHDQTEGMTMADRLILLEKGEIRQIGTPDEIYRRPADLFVARFIGSPPMNIFTGLISGRELRLEGDGQTLATIDAPDGSYKVGIRPNDLVTATDGPRLTISQSEFHGSENYLYGEIGGREFCAVEKDEFTHQVGDQVAVRFAVKALHFFDSAGGKRVEI
jgi:ABC-type sugar transport system ATPase subunit